MNNPGVSDLTELLRLSQELVPDAALNLAAAEGARYWSDNDDRAVRRIEVLLECTIDDKNGADDFLSDPRRADAVRCWFGLDPNTRKLDLHKRHEAGRLALGKNVEPGTWQNYYAQNIKIALSKRLFRRSRAEEPFSIDEAVRRASEVVSPVDKASVIESTGEQRAEQRGRRGVTWRKGVLFGLAMVAISAFAIGIPHSSNQSSAQFPRDGSVVNATTGNVEANPVVAAPEDPVRLIGNRAVVRACDLTRDWPCRFRANHLYAEDGDMIKFLVLLESESAARIPYARLNVRFGASGRYGVNLRPTLQISWPGMPKGRAVESRDVEIATNDQTPVFKYVAHSTELRLASTKFLGWLPDGIVRPTGIALTNIGPPHECFFNCVRRFTRLIEFKGIVALAPYLGSQPEEFSLHN